MRHYDVVVIGAGNAGLSAACKFAKAGKKTLLIEKHNIPGGCATSFRRGRFEFEASIHELCDYGPADNPGDTRKVLCDTCGLDIPWLEVPDTFRVVTTALDGSPLDAAMPTGESAFIDKMEQYVPGSRKSMEDFFALAEESLEASDYIMASKGNPDSALLKAKYPNFLRTAAYPTSKVLKALNMPQKAQDILGTYWCYLGVDCERLAFMHYGAMVHKYVTRKAYIPKLTSHGISLALVERFRDMGGEVWFNTRAKEILFENGRVSGVSTTMGDVAAGYVLSNVNPHIVYGTMMPPALVPEREIKLCNARKHNARALVLYLGLNKSAEALGIEDYSIFLPHTADSAKVYGTLDKIETNHYSVFVCYNVVNKEASPPGTAMVSFTTVYSEDAWKDVDFADYAKTKDLVARDMLRVFKIKTGIDLTGAIEEIEVATPWTFARFIGTPEGSIYGYETNEWDSMMARLMMLAEDSPIPGLRFAGAFGARGDGYNSAYICGDMMAGLMLRDMQEEGGTK